MEDDTMFSREEYDFYAFLRFYYKMCETNPNYLEEVSEEQRKKDYHEYYVKYELPYKQSTRK